MLKVKFKKMKSLITEENVLEDKSRQCNILLWDILNELCWLSTENFGYQDIEVYKICDLKTISDVFKTYAGSFYPSPWYGVVNANWLSAQLRLDPTESNFIQRNDNGRYIFKMNVATSLRNIFHAVDCRSGANKKKSSPEVCKYCGNGGLIVQNDEILFYDQSPEIRKELYELSKVLSKDRLKKHGFNVLVPKHNFTVGVNSLHNYMNIMDKLVKGFYNYLGRLGQIDPGAAAIGLNKLEALPEQLADGIKLYYEYNLEVDESKRKLMRSLNMNKVPRLHGNLATRMSRVICDTVDALSETYPTPRLLAYRSMMIILNETRMLLVQKTKDREFMQRKYEEVAFVGLIIYDYLGSYDYPNRWKSLSALEFFLFGPHREKLLHEKNVDSSNLSDQTGESAHAFVKRILTNNRDMAQVVVSLFRVISGIMDVRENKKRENQEVILS